MLRAIFIRPATGNITRRPSPRVPRVRAATRLAVATLADLSRQAELTAPATVELITDALRRAARQVSDRKSPTRSALTAKRDQLKQKINRLITALKDGTAAATLLAQLQSRESELAEVEAQIATATPVRRPSEPSAAWVKKQLSNTADLLRDDIATAKSTLLGLGVAFTLTPQCGKADERPYLRAEAETDVTKALFGSHDRLSPQAIMKRKW